MKLTPVCLALIALILLIGIAQQWGAGGEERWWRYLAILLMGGLLYEWINARKAKISLKAPDRQALQLGKYASVKFSLLNDSARSTMVELGCDLPGSFEITETAALLTIGAGQSQEVTFFVQPNTLGSHTIDRLPVRIMGNLRLAAWKRNLSTHSELTVNPYLRQVHRLARSTQFGGNLTPVGGSGFELHSLREYQPGDSPRTINWKASARSQKLITQVFSEEQRPSTVLVIDISRSSKISVDGINQFGHYVNLASTFAAEAITAGEEVGLVTAAAMPQCIVPPGNGGQTALHIQNALRKLRPQEEEVDLSAVALSVAGIAKKRSLIVYFTDLYNQPLEGTLSKVLALWSRQHQPLLVSLIGEDLLDISRRDSRSERDAFNSLAAADYLRNLRITAEGARRTGAKVILTNPERLQNDVLGEYRRLKALRRI